MLETVLRHTKCTMFINDCTCVVKFSDSYKIHPKTWDNGQEVDEIDIK